MEKGLKVYLYKGQLQASSVVDIGSLGNYGKLKRQEKVRHQAMASEISLPYSSYSLHNLDI